MNGVCERCGSEVIRKVKSQWMLKITEYADKLIQGLDTVDYIERVKVSQKNWIGKSQGAEVDFTLTGKDEKLRIYTTRPDTLFGVTYMVVSPEHPVLDKYKDEIKAEADQVRAVGGLYILGTERHESRRIDNQLRGRSGRQGDPGETQFYLWLEDDLMRLFGGDKMDRVSKMMVTADMGDDMPIQHKIISKAVESAQHKVESINFSMRKSVLEYDDVMNKQRQVIYAERNKILDGKDLTLSLIHI